MQAIHPLQSIRMNTQDSHSHQIFISLLANNFSKQSTRQATAATT
jgi:hypothetical protein